MSNCPTHPEYLTFRCPLTVEAADGSDKKMPRFSMVAYTGGLMRISGFPHPVVVDLEGLAIDRQDIPVRLDHNPRQGVGHTQRVVIEGGQVHAEGLVSRDTSWARDVASSGVNGYPWQASIGAAVIEAEFIPSGQRVNVNGRTFDGPLHVVRRAILKEISFVDSGADTATSARIAATGHSRKEPTAMEGINVTKTDTSTDTSTDAVAHDTDVQASNADATGTGEDTSNGQARKTPKSEESKTQPATTAPATRGTPANPSPGTSGTPTTINASASDDADPVIRMRQRIAAETRRVEAIRALCAGKHPKVEAQAIEEGWDETKTELAILRASRPQVASTVSRPGNVRGTGPQVFEAVALMASGMPNSRIEAIYAEPVLEAADKLRGVGIQEFCELASGQQQSQLELIDRFAASQITDLNRKIAALRGKLEANANAIVPVRQEVDVLAEELSTREAVAAKIKALAEAQGDPKTDEVNIAHTHRALRGREEQAVQETLALAGQYITWLRNGVGQFADKTIRLFDEAIFAGPNAEAIHTIVGVANQMGDELDRLLAQAADTVEKRSEQISDLAEELRHAHQQQELAFRNLIAKHNQAQGVATERSELEKMHNELLSKERKRAELQQQLKTLYQERAELAGQLRELWDQRFKLRQHVAHWINEGATSPIRVQIDQCGDTTDYLGALAGWMKGTVGQYNVAARKIAQYVPPTELARLVAEGRADELQAQAELGDSQVPKVIEALGRLEVQLQLDTIELADMPRIELLDGEEWKNSLQLSTGQKCTTILPILLLESDNPLLVDQPEDNLDNRYIYDTVVQAIHRVKQQRQIILITHNPNIPVLGEASAVYVLTSDGERSRLANCGCVDTCKSEIINLLEGGKEAFVRRKERYDY